jgi:hypothetical protein
MQYIDDRIEKIRCKLKPRNEIRIQSLLQGIFDVDFTIMYETGREQSKSFGKNEAVSADPFGINRPAKAKRKIFISYSQKDTRFTLTNGVAINFKEELETHLRSLGRFGLADSWSDTNLLAGENWDERLKEELADASIILFLISANLIANDYVWDEEMPLAKYHKENKNTILIPVILNRCNWKHIPFFSESNALPFKGKPIVDHNNRDEAYNEITEQLKAILEK